MTWVVEKINDIVPWSMPFGNCPQVDAIQVVIALIQCNMSSANMLLVSGSCMVCCCTLSYRQNVNTNWNGHVHVR